MLLAPRIDLVRHPGSGSYRQSLHHDLLGEDCVLHTGPLPSLLRPIALAVGLQVREGGRNSPSSKTPPPAGSVC